MTASLPCQRCGEALPPEYRFCGMCGAPLGTEAPALPAQQQAPAPARRSYVGPTVLGACGTLLCLGGVTVASAIASMQLDSIPELVVALGSPFLRDQVEGSVIEGVVDVGGSAGHTWSVATGAFFAVAVVLTLVGAAMMLAAGVWALRRYRGQGREPATITLPGAPPQNVQRPTFTSRRRTR